MKHILPFLCENPFMASIALKIKHVCSGFPGLRAFPGRWTSITKTGKGPGQTKMVGHPSRAWHGLRCLSQSVPSFPGPTSHHCSPFLLYPPYLLCSPATLLPRPPRSYTSMPLCTLSPALLTLPDKLHPLFMKTQLPCHLCGLDFLGDNE